MASPADVRSGSIWRLLLRKRTLLWAGAAAAVWIAVASTWNVLRLSFPIPAPSSNSSASPNQHVVGAVPDLTSRPSTAPTWQAQLGGPAAVPPVVDGRHIYAVVGRTAGDTHVLAIDPANGRTIWELEVESVVDHPPTVAGALLYIGTRAGRLMAIDSSTGEVRWSRDWTSAVAGPALVRDGVLYAGASEVFALDAATGKRRWRHGVGSAVAWPLAMDRGVVAVLAADSHFYLISAKNGKQRLSFPLWFTPSGGPAIGDRAVAFAGTRGRVQAMDLEATDIPFEKMIRWWRTKAYLWDVVRTPPPVPRGYLWQQRGLGGIGARALGGDDRATYYAVDDLDGGGRLVALADADGRVLWQANVETRLGSSATFAGSLVLVGAASGRVHAIDVGSGEELWTLDVGTPLAASPAVVGDLLIVAAADGYLGAFRLAP